MAGVTICFVSTGAFGGVWRTWKQARTLAEAGAEVVIVGYAHLMPAALAESGHRVVTVQQEPPPTPAAPTPPGPLESPELPQSGAMPTAGDPVIWRSSHSSNAAVRIVTNRVLFGMEYYARSVRSRIRLWRRREAYRREYRQLFGQPYVDVEIAQMQAQAGYLEDHRRYVQALARPPLYFDWQANEPLLRAVVEARPDIVHAVDLPSLDTAWKASRELGARLVYATHELWVGFVRNQDFAATPSEAAGLLAVERRLIHDADLVTVTSDQMGTRLTEMYGIRAPLTVLNSPPQRVDTAQAAHAPLRLVYHGGLSRDRNIDGLIRALPLLCESVTVDIHGFSRTAGQDTLETLARDLGVSERVRFHGSFEYHDIVRILSEYDVGVMTARVAEENFEVTLPNKIFDCMCAGLAVAMYDSPAVCSVLDQVPFGITVDATSPETIARDLEPLVSDARRVSEMKSAAVRASLDYWWPTQGRKLVEAYSTLTRTTGGLSILNRHRRLRARS